MQSTFAVDESTTAVKRRRKSGDSWQPAPPSRIAGSYQRTKAPSACLVCRTRKTKCDNIRPVCGFCQRTGGDCHYSESERSRFDPASLAILQQLDDLKNIVQGHTLLLQQQQQEANAQRSPSQTSGRSSVGTGLGAITGAFLPGNNGTATTGNYYDAPLNALNINTSYDAISPTSLDKPVLSHSSSLRFDHGRVHRNSDGAQNPHTHDARRAFDRYAAKVQTDTDMPIGTESMMNASADMGIESMLRWPLFKRKLDALKIPSYVSVVSLMETPVSGIDTDTVDGMPLKQLNPFEQPDFVDRGRIMELVDNFLVNNNLKNPILGPAGLRADAEIFAASPLAWTGRNCLMYLVMAISTLSIPFTETSTGRRVKVDRADRAFSVAEAYFHEAQQRMGCLMCADSLLAARCGFLTGAYLMHTLRILPAWKAFVQAGSNCVSYFIAQSRVDTVPDPRNAGNDNDGTHLSKRRDDAPSTSTERALEDALYWSVLKSEVELRLELGLPGSGINAIRYPHVFPCVPDMEIDGHAVSVDNEGFLVTNQPEVDRSHLTFGWFFFLAEITLKRLMYRIINTRYQLGLGHEDERSRQHTEGNGHRTDDTTIRIDPTVLDTAEFDLQLEQWMQLLPPAMQFPASWTEPPTDILPWVLRGHGIDAVELLRFPAFAAVMRLESPLSPLNTPTSASLDSYTETMRRNLTRLVREYLQNAVNRIEANANGVFHRHQGTWLAIRSCTRSALALLGTRLAMQEQRDLAVLQGFAVGGVSGGSPVDTVLMDSLLPPRWKDAVQLVRDMLHAWKPEGRDVDHLTTVLEGLLSLCDDIE
ncbi:Zcf27p [Sporothrix eucalyptigena]|uniref:Zcf27p n=1 Tax=Sporothrix eucalyptigena TaxID=1812306 RepID=A0ABP0D297_9PEZI